MTDLRPLDKFVQGRLDDSFYSPDTPVLFLTKWHPLFVYGTLKQGFSRHSAIEQCPYVGSAFTRGTGWTMYRTNKLSSYPVMMGATNETAGAVFGEVYLVSPEVIRELDFIESNGIQYGRVYRTVDIHTRTGATKTMAAWMYVGERTVWSTAIEKKGLVPCEHFSRKDKKNYKYYLFKKEHDVQPQRTQQMCHM